MMLSESDFRRDDLGDELALTAGSQVAYRAAAGCRKPAAAHCVVGIGSQSLCAGVAVDMRSASSFNLCGMERLIESRDFLYVPRATAQNRLNEIAATAHVGNPSLLYEEPARHVRSGVVGHDSSELGLRRLSKTTRISS